MYRYYNDCHLLFRILTRYNLHKHIQFRHTYVIYMLLYNQPIHKMHNTKESYLNILYPCFNLIWLTFISPIILTKYICHPFFLFYIPRKYLRLLIRIQLYFDHTFWTMLEIIYVICIIFTSSANIIYLAAHIIYLHICITHIKTQTTP